jgi:hypothetical protein
LVLESAADNVAPMVPEDKAKAAAGRSVHKVNNECPIIPEVFLPKLGPDICRISKSIEKWSGGEQTDHEVDFTRVKVM